MKKLNNGYLHPAPAKIPHYVIQDNVTFPNSIFPVLLYKGVLDLPNDHAPALIEELFESNGWSNCWRNGIFTYNHYHSNTHEVMGIYCGDCHVALGGDHGIQILIKKGDVLLIPAGVAHKNVGASIDFKCVGAYPGGKEFDMNLGKSGERPGTDKNIRKVSIPKLDPLYGKEGCLSLYWYL